MENIKSAQPSNIILPYFEEILLNDLPLQNYGDVKVAVLRKVLCALKLKKIIQNLKKYQNFILSFLLIKIERNPEINSILVYCSVQCLFRVKYVAWKVQEVPQK